MNNGMLAPDEPVRPEEIGRRDFLRTLGLGGALAAAATAVPVRQAEAQSTAASYAQVQNVLNHGADSSGVNDSAPAVNGAVNALGSKGGTVHFPPGRYRLASPINLNTTAKLRVRFAGAGIKSDVSTILVQGSYGFDANMGTLSVTAAPMFERLTFVAQNTRATILRFFMVNHSVISQCTFNDAAIAVEYDSNVRNAGYKSDASYHVIKPGCRFRNNRVGVRVTDNEGGVDIFGGHFICNKQAGDIGIDVAGGWQTRIIGSKLEGGDAGNPLGTGIRIRGGEGIRVSDVQSETSQIGVHVMGGKNHSVSGYFSNYQSGCIAGVKVEAAASNVQVNVLSGANDSSRPAVKNLSTTTKRVATEAVPVN